MTSPDIPSRLPSHNKPPILKSTTRNTKKKKDDNDIDEIIAETASGAASVSALSQFSGSALRVALGATLALYIANQNHLLPKPISAAVSRALFWPTLPVTVSRRIGKWVSEVDDVVVLGGAPFGFAGLPERLLRNYGVRGVVNMCEEYRGPIGQYEKLGMRQLWLPTVDHFEPSVDQLKKAVSFLKKHESRGQKVYVHCRAGHGRSAAVTFAWLLYKNPKADPEQLNDELCRIRNVRTTLWEQPNIKEFHSWVKRGGHFVGNDNWDEGGGARGGAAGVRTDTVRKEGDRVSNISPIIGCDSEEDWTEDNNSLWDDYSEYDRDYVDEDISFVSTNAKGRFLFEDVMDDGESSDDEKDYRMWQQYKKDD